MHDFLGKSVAVTGLVLIAGSALGAEPPKLDAFIGGLERGCRPSGPLAAFRADLNARYSFEDSHERLTAKVRIPPVIAGDVGRASAERHPYHPRIQVPLIGT